MEEKYTVAFDQKNHRFEVIPQEAYTIKKIIHNKRNHKHVYTDLFDGTDLECLKFASDNKLRPLKIDNYVSSTR